MDINVQEAKNVWVVWGNTDLTEGRGSRYPFEICEIEATAIRRAKGNYIQGTNCPYEEMKVYRINNIWYVPGDILEPSIEDTKYQEIMNNRARVARRALLLGITPKELEILQGKQNV